MSNEQALLAKNLKILRKYKGETQHELANILYVSTDAVSKYEKSERMPGEDIIQRIAEHYEIPLDILMSEEISVDYLKKRTEAIDSVLDAFNVSVLEGYTTEKAQKNEVFNEAYGYYMRILESDIPMESMIEKCKALFYKSFQDYNLTEGAVNTVALIYFDYLYRATPQNIMVDYLSDTPSTLKRLEMHSEAIGNNTKNSVKAFLRDNGDMLDRCLIAIKNDRETADIADYYLALKYIYDLCDNDETPETNRKIGMHLMYESYRFKNRYAVKYIDDIIKLYG